MTDDAAAIQVPQIVRDALATVEKFRCARRGFQDLDLATLRKNAHLSQERAARAADVSIKTWVRWEHAGVPFNQRNVEAIERLLIFITGSEDKPSS